MRKMSFNLIVKIIRIEFFIEINDYNLEKGDIKFRKLLDRWDQTVLTELTVGPNLRSRKFIFESCSIDRRAACTFINSQKYNTPRRDFFSRFPRNDERFVDDLESNRNSYISDTRFIERFYRETPGARYTAIKVLRGETGTG